MPDLLRFDDIAARIGVPAGTLRRWRTEGLMPEPTLHPSPRVLLWDVAVIDEWNTARTSDNENGAR